MKPTNKIKPEGNLMTVSEAASFLGKSYTTIDEGHRQRLFSFYVDEKGKTWLLENEIVEALKKYPTGRPRESGFYEREIVGFKNPNKHMPKKPVVKQMNKKVKKNQIIPITYNYVVSW